MHEHNAYLTSIFNASSFARIFFIHGPKSLPKSCRLLLEPRFIHPKDFSQLYSLYLAEIHRKMQNKIHPLEVYFPCNWDQTLQAMTT